jgi:pyruvate dehydrogenase E1 component
MAVMNANYTQASIPVEPEVPEGLLRGLYRLLGSEAAQVQLLGSGAIMMEVLTAKEPPMRTEESKQP